MAEIKSKYFEPDYLNEFAKYIPINSQFSAGLSPNIPEFLDAKHNEIYPTSIPGLENFLVPQEQKLKDNQIKTLSLMHLCQKYDIYPFRTLKFRSAYGRLEKPEILYINKSVDSCSSDLDKVILTKIAEIALDPSQFSIPKKWYGIWFEEIEIRDVKAAKESILKYIDGNYTVDYIRTELNPSYSRGEYADYFESDLTISISKGIISAYNYKIERFPEGFEFPNTKEKLKQFFEGTNSKSAKVLNS